MTKKKKGQEADGEDDREQSRTPVRSELDKLEGKIIPHHVLCEVLCCHFFSVYSLTLLCV